MNPRAKKQAIPRRPLLWFAAALVFSVPPMFGNLVWWVPVSFLLVLITKFRMEQRGLRLRSTPWKLAAAAMAIGGVKLQYHSLIGLEPGLSISILLISIKILEAHTARDFHILALLGWFLGLSGLFVSQGIGAGLYAMATFWLILTAVSQYHTGGASSRGIIRPLLSSAGLILFAIPLLVVMFLVFPRGSGPFRFDLKRSLMNRTGMSDHLSPGSVSSLAESTEVAFRVEFPDGNVPKSQDLYWRGTVLMRDDGLEWSPSKESMTRSRPEHVGGVPVLQRIIIEPNNGEWLFALDWPNIPGKEMLFNDMSMQPGNTIHATKPLYSPRRYEITSFPNNRESQLRSIERKACLQLPEDIPPQASRLVESWTQDGADARTIVSRALDFFRKQHFVYSLSPGTYGADGLEDFLFKRRIGFCEHYAAAFGTLLRMAGIPTRVVIGYQGGQFNSLGSYLLVRQSDAHAWCEVWIPNEGWERADPTAAVAPGRLDLDLAATAQAGTAGAGDLQGGGTWGKQPFFRQIQLAWDTISYEWDAHVLNFDEETQRTFFVGLGLIDTRPLRLLGWLALIAVVLLCLQSIWLWWMSRVPKDSTKSLYEQFCRRLAVLGVDREPWEGPASFACRAAQSLPAYAAQIDRVAGIYTALRYAPHRAGIPTAGDLAREIKAFCSRKRNSGE